VNYRFEPFSARNVSGNPSEGWEAVFSNTALATPADPVTPTLLAPARMATRLRLLFPGGSTNNGASPPAIFVLQGHNWPEEPYAAGGRRIGDNPRSQRLGAREHSANETIDVDVRRAGGTFGVAGDYLYHSYMEESNFGTWGLLRVQTGGAFIAQAWVNAINQLSANGLSNRDQDGKRAPSVDLYSVKLNPDRTIQSKTKLTKVPLPVNPNTGAWRLDASAGVTVPEQTLIEAEPTAGGPSPASGTVPILVVVPKKVD
jgi:hypothetical protein